MNQRHQRVLSRDQRPVMERRRPRYLLPVFTALGLMLWGTGALAATTTVTESDFAFTPSTVKVSRGATVEVRNVTSSTSHTFTVSGKGIDIVNDPGQARDVTINLPPGSYPFICRFHVSLGMKGTLVVEAATPSPTPSPGPTSSSTNTPGPIPSGGVQSGAGGTARHFPVIPLGLGLGALFAALGALALRRHARA